MSRDRSFWGWGYKDYELDKSAIEQYKELLKAALGIKQFSSIDEPLIENIEIRKPRFELPDELQDLCTSDDQDRAAHSYGKSFRDIWRGSHGIFDNPPDYIAYPKTEGHILSLYQFAEKNNVSIVPYGGGSSVSGGIEPTTDESYNGVITVDMKHFDQVLEINQESRTARIQGGIFGPVLEQALKPHGLTLRHFPQSFEFSTLGGWIVTRSGGHYASLYTHIDEFVQSVRMVTPNGIMQSRRLPGSGAGPSEERLVSGSEGIFGIVTEAWMRLQHIPRFKASKSISFSNWQDAINCCREISQSGLHPTNARLVDPMEAMSNGLGDGQSTVIILGFESANHDVKDLMTKGLSICKNHNGIWKSDARKSSTAPEANKRDKAADNWKASFLRAPYLRDHFIRMGCIMETFETAITWDQFEVFHTGIISAANKAIKEIAGGGFITVRFTHIYPDGPAPYYTIIAKGQTGKEMEQWDQIKKIVSDKIIKLGGTITHHHAVGKDHQAHYEQQQSGVFNSALKAIKDEVDPKWILNPDVLIKK